MAEGRLRDRVAIVAGAARALGVLLPLLAVPLTPAGAATDAEAAAAIDAAVVHPDRPAADRLRDARRRPDRVLRFLGARPGMRVADLMAGGGWYTELLSRAVGPGGRVVAQNNRISARNYGERLAARLVRDRLPNVVVLEAELEELPFAPGELDAVLMVQFYHDTIWMGVDRARTNRRIFEALAPGGVFLVIDHSALEGTGGDESKRLHRVEEAFVAEEITAAGFVLEASSGVLRNPDDSRTHNAFDFRIRSRTDRFVLLFRKPGGEEAR